MTEEVSHGPITEAIGSCLRLDGTSLQYIPLPVTTPGSAVTADVTGEGVGKSLGAGIAHFEDISFDWVHPTDEAVYIVSGELIVTSSSGTITGRPGDILFMSQGAELSYRTVGKCTVFAALTLDGAEADNG